MLEPKDYCNIETIEALQSIGIEVNTDAQISLYEAQRLLRDKLRIFVEIPLISYMSHFNPSVPNYKIRISMSECPITHDSLIAYVRKDDGTCHEFIEYEEALQFGIKSACNSYKAMLEYK